MLKLYIFLPLFFSALSQKVLPEQSIHSLVKHNFANNNGVKIHYASLGDGPLILFIHGFPDFWYTWRNQMSELSEKYTTIAMDLRGYNLSDSPIGIENYYFDKLESDVSAVIKHTGHKSAFIVAHDWGAAIAWRFSSNNPLMVKKLTILNIAHPKAGKKIHFKKTEKKSSSYVDTFISDAFYKNLDENWFSAWVRNKKIKIAYKEAFKKSSKRAMINYYKANISNSTNFEDPSFLKRSGKILPNIKVPVLVIHGKKDIYAPTSAHNNTWEFIDNEFTLIVLPNAGHFTQRDESSKVTHLIKEFIE